MSTTAYVFGFGRIKMGRSFELRLYSCREGQPVWDANVAVEGSSGIWTNAFMGKSSYGTGSQADEAAAKIVAAKLVADMGFVAGSPPTQSAERAALVEASPGQLQVSAAALTMTKVGHLYVSASPSSRVLKTLREGTLLYPTGGASGLWREVADEEGVRGWVSSRLTATTGWR